MVVGVLTAARRWCDESVSVDRPRILANARMSHPDGQQERNERKFFLSHSQLLTRKENQGKSISGGGKNKGSNFAAEMRD